MPESPSAAAVVSFDVFQVDLRAGELTKQGRRIRLQDQPFRILALLLGRAGEVVTRDELRQELWPADTFVDFDHGLNSAVARLREALRDSAEKPRFIETIAKRGYRFIAPLESTPVTAPSSPVPVMHREKISTTRISEKIWMAAAVCFALFGAACIGALYRPNSDSQLSRIEVVPLVGLRGFQATPAFSPDGTMVAFRQSDGDRNVGIYVSSVGSEKSVQITNNHGDCCPTWSPTGDRIAFTRYSNGTVGIYTVPALGGTELRLHQGVCAMDGGLSWSPDGKFIAFTETSSADPTLGFLALLSVADSTVSTITSPPPGWLDHEPAFSPDGTQMAFIRSTVAGVSNDVYVMPASGGQAKRLTFDNRPIMGPPTWTADSREIIFSSDRAATTGLWRVSPEGGPPRPVAGPEGNAKWPSIPAKRGDNLVYEQWVSKADVWRLQLKDARHYEKPPSPLIAEKGFKMRPEFSPDGKKVAFESDRLGFWDIWTCDIDGSNCDRVTSLHGTAGRARWSPDGKYIAFEFHPKERSEIYMVEVPGGVPRLFRTIANADNLSPAWSRDGKWLYFASKHGAEPFQIWKISLSGGTPFRLTKNGGISPVESPNGRYLYYSKYEQGGIWRMPVDGGDETEILTEGGSGNWPDWAISEQGIYFLKYGQFPRVSIDFFDFATQKSTSIWTLQKEPGWGLSLSNDGKSIAYVQNEFAESNLMLVRNFR